MIKKEKGNPRVEAEGSFVDFARLCLHNNNISLDETGRDYRIFFLFFSPDTRNEDRVNGGKRKIER